MELVILTTVSQAGDSSFVPDNNLPLAIMSQVKKEIKQQGFFKNK